jgi:hypothetical protein
MLFSLNFESSPTSSYEDYKVLRTKYGKPDEIHFDHEEDNNEITIMVWNVKDNYVYTKDGFMDSIKYRFTGFASGYNGPASRTLYWVLQDIGLDLDPREHGERVDGKYVREKKEWTKID